MNLVIGIGCRRNVPCKEIQEAVEAVLNEHQLDIKGVSLLASVDLKKDETGLLEYAKFANLATSFYPADKLNSVNAKETSDFVKEVTGTASVCEAAAIVGSDMGKLVVNKVKFKRVTVAVACKI